MLPKREFYSKKASLFGLSTNMTYKKKDCAYFSTGSTSNLASIIDGKNSVNICDEVWEERTMDFIGFSFYYIHL